MADINFVRHAPSCDAAIPSGPSAIPAFRPGSRLWNAIIATIPFSPAEKVPAGG